MKLDTKNKIFNKFTIKKEYHFESLMMSMIEGLHLWLVSSVGDAQVLSSPRRFHSRSVCLHAIMGLSVQQLVRLDL